MGPPNGLRSAAGDEIKAAADGGTTFKLRPPAAAAINTFACLLQAQLDSSPREL
jgi:hypothetical protein